MKKIIYILLVGVLFAQCTPKVKTVMTSPETEDFRAHQPAAGPAPEIKLGDYQQFELDNGVKVIVVENDKVPRVSFRLFIDNPPVMEGEKAGVSEFEGDLLSRGSKTRTKAQLDEEIDFIGADFFTYSSGFYAASLSKYTDKLMGIVSDAIFNPAFSKEEFEKLKTQTLSSLASNKEDPNAIAGNVQSVLDYGKKHPYGELKTEKTVGNISVEDCKKYYDDYFRPNNAYLIFVGDISMDDAKKMATKYFSKWEPKAIPTPTYPAVPFPKKTTVDFVNKTGAVQSVVKFTYPVDLKPNSPDVIKAGVMNTLLGGFFRSRLNQNLREDHAYTYGVRSRLSRDELVGVFSAGGSVRNEVTDSAVYQINYELNRLITEPVPADELDLVKNVMAGQFGRSLEDPRTLARFALNVARYNLPKNYYHEYLKNLDAVSAADVQMMAKKYIHPDACHILVVGDKGEVAEKLAKFGELHYFDTYGNPIRSNASSIGMLSMDKLMEKHIEAMGGKVAMDGVKSLVTTYTAEVQGNTLNIWTAKVNGEKYAMKVSMMGQTMQEQRFSNGKGMNIGQGQKKAMEDAELQQTKFESFVFAPQALASLGDNVKMAGVDNKDGKDYYVVQATIDDTKYLMYFDATNYLLARMEVIVRQGDQSQTIVMNFSDYKEKDGVLIPMKYSLSGVMPMALDFKLDKVEINGSVDDGWFSVE